MAEDPSEKRLYEGYKQVVFGQGTDHERTLWVPAGTNLPDPHDTLEIEPKTEEIPVVVESVLDSEMRKEKTTDTQLLEGRFHNGIYVSEDGEECYRTHRHWREPLLRLLIPQTEASHGKQLDKWYEKRRRRPSKRQPQRYGPLWYAFSVYGALICILVGSLVYTYSPESRGAAVLVILLALLLLGHSVYREWYRWRKRGVLIRITEEGIRITYNQPDKLLLGFNGDRKGLVKSLEGSTDLTPLISWPNKLIFWGCGDLAIASTIESDESPLLENIPRVRRLQVFMSQA